MTSCDSGIWMLMPKVGWKRKNKSNLLELVKHIVIKHLKKMPEELQSKMTFHRRKKL